MYLARPPGFETLPLTLAKLAGTGKGTPERKISSLPETGTVVIHVLVVKLYVVVAVPAATASLADQQPVGRPVADTAEAFPLDKALRQARCQLVFALPICAQPAQHQAQDVAGQMRYAHMG
jgi:hypothetical protein